MSNFQAITRHPVTGEMKNAQWIDGHFEGRFYGVRFPDGQVFHQREIEPNRKPEPPITILADAPRSPDDWEDDSTAPRPKRVYIAGPMTGKPEYNFRAFDRARDRLQGLGFDVVSPADIDRDHGFDATSANPGELPPRADIVRRDLDALRGCDAICLLDGWQESKGARAEKAVAEWLLMEVLFETDLANDITAIRSAKSGTIREAIQEAKEKKENQQGKRNDLLDGNASKLERGTTRENTLRRLARDGHDDLLDAIANEEISVNKAAIQVERLGGRSQEGRGIDSR